MICNKDRYKIMSKNYMLIFRIQKILIKYEILFKSSYFCDVFQKV